MPATVEPIVPLLPYQREDVECSARFRWNCWARQTGKSFTKSLRRILRGIARRRNQIFLSAGERQSRELMQKARAHCQALQIATEFRDDQSLRGMCCKTLEITLPNGVRIIGLPANPRTARGFTGDVFLDEFAMHADDRDIWAAMFPTLLRGDGELDVASTPQGKGNTFFQLRENQLFSAHTLTLTEAISQGLQADAEQMRLAMDDDAIYRQEFLCEFIDEATAFLTYEQIAACTDANLVPHGDISALAAESGELFAGVDIGRRRDLTVFWVFASGAPSGDATTAGDHALSEQLRTVALVEMCNAPFTVQFELLCELLRLPQLRRCCIDAGGLGMQLAEQAVEQFGSHRVETIVFTNALKSQMAGALRVAVERRRIVIPADERIRRDWHSVERTVTEAGHFRLAAPRRDGSHADRFWAAALAIHAAGAATGIVEHFAARRLNFAQRGTW
ncbi:MAG: hypothetical protein HY287_05890 [Planctomycetes bacterium]|nr:hypothetical protein [Planctomycetota bacterium]MBI3833843.1 hypothetical protein [Planctomycetota bacterium]